MNKHKKLGHDYLHRMEIRLETTFQKQLYSKTNLINLFIDSIKKEIDTFSLALFFVKVFKLIMFSYKILNILINNVMKHFTVNNKSYITFLYTFLLIRISS